MAIDFADWLGPIDVVISVCASAPAAPIGTAPPVVMPGTAAAGGGAATDGAAVSEPFLFDFPKGESGTLFFSGGAIGFFGVSTTVGGAGLSSFATAAVVLTAGGAT